MITKIFPLALLVIAWLLAESAYSGKNKEITSVQDYLRTYPLAELNGSLDGGDTQEIDSKLIQELAIRITSLDHAAYALHFLIAEISDEGRLLNILTSLSETLVPIQARLAAQFLNNNSLVDRRARWHKAYCGFISRV